ANIAMRFAVLFPEKVEKLVLDGGNMIPNGMKLLVLVEVLLGYFLCGILRRFHPKAKKGVELFRLMVEDPNLTDEELRSITAPSLVMAGDKDMIRESHTRKIASLIPRSELVILKGSHFVAHENPSEFNRCVLGFLNRT
ncbi:MAG: alpha/beta hydrolase, partial [Spirochaetales bacterium]|nr:alpha/beta hydrolase [Candidatus Physcosoma equi]